MTQKIIVFVSFEGPWFPAGGIAAVMGKLPGAVEEASALPTVVITPFHVHSPKMAALPVVHLGDVDLPHGKDSVRISVLHCSSAPLWYFLRGPETPAHTEARDQEPAFFAGVRHPYDMPPATLIRDSLLFGAAVVKALPLIARQRNLDHDTVEWNLMAQDWEAATSLLAFASQSVVRGRLHLTLHNSYDEYVPAMGLAAVGIEPSACPGATILQRAFSCVEKPALTVSDQFALDFTHELLERDVMAPHLQSLLATVGIAGVDNGPFKTLAVSATALDRAATGDYALLQAWKAANRQNALTALDGHASSEEAPLWGDRDRFRRDDSPWFVMAGRDDPRQKGYDVAVAAIGDYLADHHGDPHCAQFLFFPIPGDEGRAGLGFLRELAARYPEDVLAFPFIWIAGFGAALQGAAYGLMPSLYEPFGMANEFYLSGCVGIARATGGNIEQVVPYRGSAAWTPAVAIRSAPYHASADVPTGILFRERDGIASASHDWNAINAAGYGHAGAAPNRVEERRELTLFREMADQLGVAIEDGIRVYRDEPALYYRMLAGGVGYIQATFSWQRAALEYARKVDGGPA